VEAASIAKDNFLAVLSHELRTPLSPVLMATETLLRQVGLAEPVRKTLEMISRNVKIEAHFIDDLLDLTLTSRGKLEIALKSMECSRSCERRSGDLPAGNPGQTSKADSGVGYFRTYYGRRHCATSTGRMKFAEKCLEIQPAMWRYPCMFPQRAEADFVEISDTGIGIEPQALSTVFDAFTQGNEDIARQFGGLGLGLAISKATIAAHGGTLRAASG
jgi:two-component system CheB/CheR fusion protein